MSARPEYYLFRMHVRIRSERKGWTRGWWTGAMVVAEAMFDDWVAIAYVVQALREQFIREAYVGGFDWSEASFDCQLYDRVLAREAGL